MNPTSPYSSMPLAPLWPSAATSTTRAPASPLADEGFWLSSASGTGVLSAQSTVDQPRDIEGWAHALMAQLLDPVDTSA
jgi:hypothetical protein